MTDKKPEPTPRHTLALPANFVDKTAEKIDTVIGIVGATANATKSRQSDEP
jgi:hypothetical protein